MKTAKFAAIGAASIFAVVALLLAYPAMAATQNPAAATTSTSIIPSPTALTTGQTTTFTSTNGVWHLLGSPSAASGVRTGTASGTATLTVTGAFAGGYAMSLTSGSITINGTTYAFANGSAEMGAHQAHLVGQGTLASATPGSFLFSAGAHANFQGSTYNTLRFDVQVNGQEYGVLLLVTAQVS
jgi:hypothetical protein